MEATIKLEEEKPLHSVLCTACQANAEGQFVKSP